MLQQQTRFFRHTVSAVVVTLGASMSLAAVADTDRPFAQPDDTWINISGTVDSVSQDAFKMDYGPGLVTVEMDDGDRDADGYKLMKGDKVSVSGIVDEGMFEKYTIEASAVYVENINTPFFASPRDEEELVLNVELPVSISHTVLRGTVTEVNEDDFMLDTGLTQIEVDVDEMAYNPLDEEGYQRIQAGDRVRVTGYLDNELFDGRVFDARSVMTLSSS